MDERSHWDRVYGTGSAEEMSWFQPRAARSLAIIRPIARDRACRVVDVGGGASTLVDDLLDLPDVDVTLLDISATALAVARWRLGQRAEHVQWLVGDITQMELPRHAYDIWHDRAVFHFLTSPEQRSAYLARVRHAVRPGGHVIVAAFGPDGPLQCSGLPVVRYSPQALHAQFGDAFELVEHSAEAHRTPAGVVQLFIYCHFTAH